MAVNVILSRPNSYTSRRVIDMNKLAIIIAIMLFVISIDCRAETAEEYYVNADQLNVRDAPNGNIIEKLKRSEEVVTYERSGSWIRISSENAPPRWVSLTLLCTGNDCWMANSNTTKVYDPKVVVARAQAAVRKRLIDPYSAQFTTLFVKKDGTLCGTVNAKNRFGGYVGATDFIFSMNGNGEPIIANNGNHQLVTREDLTEDYIRAVINAVIYESCRGAGAQ